ncbi:MAG: deoxyguanosinetriphosphate triphosphohydrolase [Lachnospiraceae bacterium]|nr:deoxyguanosinetriphosphate triphosphohydrolase [Lachnospiraceae bacterium]
MTIRESLEQMEQESLSPYASLSIHSKGRDREEPQCDIRPVYQRDRDRILHCKAFRRLKSKTQVFLDPQGDHYRTRMTHTLEVSQNARTIGKALRLNEELIEAIALGHDLGHTPFGHAGERTLNALCDEGFKHNEQSVRIVEKLEKNGEGLNLTVEVRDGMLNHQTSTMPHTLEGKIVRLSDKIAYINHDIDDAIRARVLSESDIPASIKDVLGNTTTKRLDTLIHDIIIQSMGKNDIIMSPDVELAMKELRGFMFERVYMNKTAKAEEVKAKRLLEFLFEHYMDNFDRLPEKFRRFHEEDGDSKQRVICDYISGMTDEFAYNLFEDYFLPKSWQIY